MMGNLPATRARRIVVRAEWRDEYVEYVRSHMPWLGKLAYLLCQDWDRADDVVQTAITQLYVHWGKARAADNVDAYVRTVLTRAFLNERRSAWSRRVQLQDFDRSVEADDTATALAVRQALLAVPPRQRAALVLRYYCDMSIEDTAVALRCTTGTVKSQTSKGLRALRRAMGGEADGRLAHSAG
ncbi:RNA polymerase sigma24 factor [Lentzea sp. NBRC 105346]|nr:RNA polymerase sigma24 factor [Lentzea sp. NBRC 105346]